MNFKKTALTVALGTALGLSACASQAVTLQMDYDGLFTMLSPVGNVIQNDALPYYYDTSWGYGVRTQITGTMSFNTATGAGSATVDPFNFFAGSGQAVFNDVQFQAVGGGLMLGNMLYSWNGSDVVTQIVLDASGLFAALSNGGVMQGPYGVIDGAYCAATSTCAIPASNGVANNTVAIGPALVATSTFNTMGQTGTTTTIGQLSLGVDDGIGGSPMDNGPTIDFNINLDITSVNPIPVPAAVWLFGSGLVGLAGVARRRKV